MKKEIAAYVAYVATSILICGTSKNT